MTKKLTPKKINAEGFQKYGSFADMLNPPVTNSANDRPVSFMPDMAVLNLGQATNASFSVTRVKPRENKINFMEYHSFTGEGILPLDGDVYVYLAPPSSPKGQVPMDAVEVFLVPKGTLLTIRMGVWHGAPFAAGPESVSVLCVLPERTYANDGFFHMVPKEDQIEIV